MGQEGASAQVREFCGAVRARSAEHAAAVRLLARDGATAGVLVGLLRQELDSMVRTIFLLSLSEPSRARLLEEHTNEERWTLPTPRGRERVVTDAEMVALAERLHGWTRNVYRFGCAFIHLSRLHSYRTVDPLSLLSLEERGDVLGHLRSYHGCPDDDGVTFADIVPYFPRVFEKIASNLECYLRQLEAGVALDGLSPPPAT